MIDLDQMTRGFIACMLWAENSHLTDDGPDLSPDDCAPSTLSAARELCESFAHYCAETGLDLDDVPGMDAARIGHDLWLTQAGHGAGFWDRGLGVLGDALTKAADTISAECYVGDDGMVYLCGYENHKGATE